MANLNLARNHSRQKSTRKTTFPAKCTSKNADPSEEEEEATVEAEATGETVVVAVATADAIDVAAVADTETADTKLKSIISYAFNIFSHYRFLFILESF